MSTSNPWVPQPAQQEAERMPEPDPGVPPVATGAARPRARGVRAPDQVDQLAVRDQPAAASLWLVGTHGGAGESTLAGLDPAWRASEHAWPRLPEPASPARVVLVARSNAAGLTSAQRAATHWASGSLPFIELLGLVLIADAPGRMPKPLRDHAKVIAGGVPRTWHLPWVEAWRLGRPPAESAPAKVQRLTTTLNGLTTEESR